MQQKIRLAANRSEVVFTADMLLKTSWYCNITYAILLSTVYGRIKATQGDLSARDVVQQHAHSLSIPPITNPSGCCHTHALQIALEVQYRRYSSYSLSSHAPSTEPPSGVVGSIVLEHQPGDRQCPLARLSGGLERSQVVPRDLVWCGAIKCYVVQKWWNAGVRVREQGLWLVKKPGRSRRVIGIMNTCLQSINFPHRPFMGRHDVKALLVVRALGKPSTEL